MQGCRFVSFYRDPDPAFNFDQTRLRDPAPKMFKKTKNKPKNRGFLLSKFNFFFLVCGRTFYYSTVNTS